jgi:hypothetical protein
MDKLTFGWVDNGDGSQALVFDAETWAAYEKVAEASGQTAHRGILCRSRKEPCGVDVSWVGTGNSAHPVSPARQTIRSTPLSVSARKRTPPRNGKMA